MPQQRECLRLVGTLTRAIERILHSTPHAAPTGISLRAFFFKLGPGRRARLDTSSWSSSYTPLQLQTPTRTASSTQCSQGTQAEKPDIEFYYYTNHIEIKEK
jgi:hypothetical protein